VTDLLAEATAELYAADPDEFTQRRTELAAEARHNGDASAAKSITALRKPTRSAWVVNSLVRAHPEAAGRLAELAAELRAGGNGPRIRELTEAKGKLVDELTRQAFAVAGTPAPPAALREDVIATLSAALADPEVAAEVEAGTLTRAAHWAGFGLIPLSDEPPKPKKKAPVPPADDLEPRRRTREKITIAKRTLAQASDDLETASMAERELEETVRGLETELEQARERLALARRAAYRAESRRNKAAAELERLEE
jgi:hypothetical protein